MLTKTLSKLLLPLTIGLLALSACNFASGEPTPTQISVEAAYTSAAQTVEAQFTGTAAAQPSATPSPPLTATSTVTVTPAATTPTQVLAATQPPFTGGGGGSGAVGCNNSLYIADVTIPDNQQVTGGTAFTKTWRVQNTGTCAWNSNYKLTFVSGEALGGATTPINQTVEPGTSADISIALTAPTTPKTYISYWTLATDTGQSFGTSLFVQIVVVAGTPGTALPGPTGTFGPVGCYNSALVSMIPNDGVTIQPGETFRKSWVIKNTGTCEWNGDFRFVFMGGDILRDNTTNKLRRGTIKAGNTVEYALEFTAPHAPGTYTSTWRLMADNGLLFGPSFTSRIVVPGPTFTPTVPPSSTPVPTIADTDTPTPLPTETP